MSTILLLIIYLAFISLGLPDPMLGATWPVMQHDMGARLETAGALSMTISVSTILSSLLSGAVIRRFGTGRVTLASCILTAGALFGFAAAPSIAWLIVLAVPLGLGGGAVDAGLNHYVAERYEAHHMSWLHCFWGVGATAGPIIMAACLSGGSSWRDGYLGVAVIQAALVVILILSLPLWNRVRKEGAGNASLDEAEPLQAGEADDAKRARGVKYALASFLFYCGVESTAGLWGSSYLVNMKGLPADQAAKWVSIYFAGITIGRFVAGFVTFKVSNKRLIRIGQVMALAGTVLLLLPLPTAYSLAGFLITGLGLAPIFPCMLHETPARFGRANASRIMGYQIAVAYTGSTLIPPLLGLLAGLTTIGIFPLYIAVAAGAMLLASERLNGMIAAWSRRSEAA